MSNLKLDFIFCNFNNSDTRLNTYEIHSFKLILLVLIQLITK